MKSLFFAYINIFLASRAHISDNIFVFIYIFPWGINAAETKSVFPPQDATLDVSNLEAWESKHGRIPDGAVVVCYSGWGRKYSKQPEKYFGARPEEVRAAGIGKLQEMVHYPGFGGEAAEWLVENRRGKSQNSSNICWRGSSSNNNNNSSKEKEEEEEEEEENLSSVIYCCCCCSSSTD